MRLVVQLAGMGENLRGLRLDRGDGMLMTAKETLLAIAVQHKERLRSTPIADLSEEDFNLLCLLAESRIS